LIQFSPAVSAVLPGASAVSSFLSVVRPATGRMVCGDSMQPLFIFSSFLAGASDPHLERSVMPQKCFYIL
jgi:hypothetical protein